MLNSELRMGKMLIATDVAVGHCENRAGAPSADHETGEETAKKLHVLSAYTNEETNKGHKELSVIPSRASRAHDDGFAIEGEVSSSA